MSAAVARPGAAHPRPDRLPARAADAGPDDDGREEKEKEKELPAGIKIANNSDPILLVEPVCPNRSFAVAVRAAAAAARATAAAASRAASAPRDSFWGSSYS